MNKDFARAIELLQGHLPGIVLREAEIRGLYDEGTIPAIAIDVPAAAKDIIDRLSREISRATDLMVSSEPKRPTMFYLHHRQPGLVLEKIAAACKADLLHDVRLDLRKFQPHRTATAAHHSTEASLRAQIKTYTAH